MIVYRQWQKRRGAKRLFCEGWFLFGIIPLYLRYRDYDLPEKFH